MKNFSVTQLFEASSEAVAAAYNKRRTWEEFAGLPFVGDPRLESFEQTNAGDETSIAMAYHVSIKLSPLAEPFIDAEKLTFVERTTLNATGSGKFAIVPDHYPQLLKASGKIEMVSFDDGRCERLIQGSVDVSLGWSGKLFEGPVEEGIVTGLIQALAAQAEQVTLR